MNTKEIKITVPEGYEIDRKNSTFECIKFKKKGLTYENIAEKLFKNKRTYFIGAMSNISDYAPEGNGVYLPNQAPSKKQLQRLLAINKLMNVAEYLNEGWKPDWTDSTHKWYLLWRASSKKFDITGLCCTQYTGPVFRTPDLALQAIDILGEDEVKLALGV